MTLEVTPDSPVWSLPWIITFGPLDDEQWEPVVCGPYERPHALALAEEIVADQELMAVVEPVLPYVSVAEIQAEIESARAADEELDTDLESDLAEEDGYEADEPEIAEHDDRMPSAPSGPPTPDEIRAGFIRIAQRLARQDDV